MQINFEPYDVFSLQDASIILRTAKSNVVGGSHAVWKKLDRAMHLIDDQINTHLNDTEQQ